MFVRIVQGVADPAFQSRRTDVHAIVGRGVEILARWNSVQRCVTTSIPLHPP